MPVAAAKRIKERGRGLVCSDGDMVVFGMAEGLFIDALFAWKVTKLRVPNSNLTNYFTSNDPHHDIYTFSYWQIFWHSI